MQDKGRSPAIELEGNLANPCPGGRAARRGRADHRSLQGKPAAPRFSHGGTGRGGGKRGGGRCSFVGGPLLGIMGGHCPRQHRCAQRRAGGVSGVW